MGQGGQGDRDFGVRPVDRRAVQEGESGGASAMMAVDERNLPRVGPLEADVLRREGQPITNPLNPRMCAKRFSANPVAEQLGERSQVLLRTMALPAGERSDEPVGDRAVRCIQSQQSPGAVGGAELQSGEGPP